MTTQEALFDYCQRLGDNSLILGHRLSEWCGRGPILEQDIALINVALDLIGQSRTLLQYAAEVEGKGRNEDKLAYLRVSEEFRNVLLAEQENGHFGTTLVRQLIFDVFHYYFYTALTKSKDTTLAAFAEKSLKEVSYHMKYSAEWIIRLGDGTAESKARVQEAFDDLWMYSGELFEMDEVDAVLIEAGIAPDLNTIKTEWTAKMQDILKQATLEMPASGWMISGGKKGKHSELLGFILAEMQYMQRAYPNMEW